MKNILLPSNAKVLADFAGARVLLGFDFDGTLSPITPVPARAGLRARTRTLLTQLTALYPCVVLSGRSRPDVLKRLEGVNLADVVGSHGVEPWSATARVAARVARWRRRLERELADEPGVIVEDKRYSLAVHYRASPNKPQARRAIARVLPQLQLARAGGGKLVVNIVPREAPHKGEALLRLMRRLRCERAIYLGDDVTDEDVFALDDPARLLGIRVGASPRSKARYCVPRQAAVDRLLARLLLARSGATGGARAVTTAKRRARS